MSKLGVSVKDAISFLEEFFVDVSKLLLSVEENMVNNGFSSYGDSASYWYLSRAYYLPKQWLPKYFVRMYTPKDKNNKADKKSAIYGFVDVCLAPANFDEPIIVWGIGQQIERKDIWHIMDSLGFFNVKDDLVPFVTEITSGSWSTLNRNPDSLKQFLYQAKTLTDFNGSVQIVEEIVSPIVQHMNAI